tara:strand:- start:51 stop:440 length:390 start_codon:yes stop_codon:yes gene_type:complete
MNIKNTYKILKLISGETIICELTESDGKYRISRPMQMHIHPQMSMMGMSESLMLSRWVEPFTEEESFEIDPKHVIITLTASPGLSIYYAGVMNKIDTGREITSSMDNINKEDIYDELLEELEVESKSIH